MNAILLSILVFGFSQLSHAGPFIKAVDAPAPTLVQGTHGSANDAVRKMYFTEKVPMPDHLEDRVFTGVDLIGLEVDEINAIIKAPGEPDTKKIVYVRYTSGDPRLSAALIRAWQIGIPVEIYMDLNTVLSPNEEAGPGMSNEFDKLKARQEDSPGYVAYQAFLAAGMRTGVDIFSQPIHNVGKDERAPIFHEKALLTKAKGRRSKAFVSSANAAPNPRVNRTLEIEEEAFVDYYLDHVKDLKTLFSDPHPRAISELPPRAPLVIEYPDETRLQLSFTDGKYNPNDNIVAFLRTEHLKSALLSHFAFSYARMADALAENLEIISPEARATLLLDDRFAELVTWGVGLVLKGLYVTSPPFPDGGNRLLFGKGTEVASRVDLFVNQRGALDPDTGEMRLETEDEGAPIARHVNHEKTTLFVTTDGRVFIAFGSFNASNNFHNADSLMEIHVSEKSWIYEGFNLTIRGLIDQERDKTIFESMDATLRNAIGMLTGHTDLDVALETARDFQRAFWNADGATMREILNRYLDTPTHLTDAAPIEKRREYVRKFLEFAPRYVQKVARNKRNDLLLMKVLSLIPAITEKPMTDYNRFTLMEGIYFGVVKDDERAPLVEDDRITFGFKEKKASKKPYVRKPHTASIFDLDDTLFKMPTKIRLFHRTDKTQFLDVSTEFFAQNRLLLGVPKSGYEQWEFLYPESFVQFQASENWRDGYFIPHLDKALADPDGRAGALDALIQSMSTSKGAKSTYLGTARGHSKQEIVMGFVRIRSVIENEIYRRTGVKVYLHLPPRKNLMMFSGAGEHVSEAKAAGLLPVVDFEVRYRGAAEVRFYEDDDHTRDVFGAEVQTRMPEKADKVKVLHPRDAERTGITSDTCEGLIKGSAAPPNNAA